MDCLKKCGVFKMMKNVYNLCHFETKFCLNTVVVIFNLDLKEKKSLF